jgi:hypothetical protein
MADLSIRLAKSDYATGQRYAWYKMAIDHEKGSR